MLLRYTTLPRKPAIFKALTGLTVALFDDLMWDLGPAYRAAYERKERAGRQRAGAGDGTAGWGCGTRSC